MTDETKVDLTDCLVVLIFSLLMIGFGLVLAGVCHAATPPRNVGQVMLPPPPVWPPPRSEWLRVDTEFVKSHVVDAQQSSKAACTTPPIKWHGLHLRRCDVLKDKSVACMYDIAARFTGKDGKDLGMWHGLVGTIRKTCHGTFKPEVVEMLPPSDAPDSSDESGLDT